MEHFRSRGWVRCADALEEQESAPLTRTIGHEADGDLCCIGKCGWLSLLPLIVPFSLNAHRRQSCRMIAFSGSKSLGTAVGKTGMRKYKSI